MFSHHLYKNILTKLVLIFEEIPSGSSIPVNVCPPELFL